MQPVWTLVSVVCLATVAFGFPASESQAQEPSGPSSILESGVDKVYRFIQGCGNKEMSLCIKMRALTFVDNAVRGEQINVMDGISFVRTETNEHDRTLNGRALSEQELDASLPSNSDDRNTQVENLLVDRIARFLQSHTLQFKLPESSISEFKETVNEARKKKPKKILLPLLLLFKLKAAALIPLALGALALLALKALIVGKLALVLSALIGLQKLLASKHHTQSYEVVAHPHYSEHEHGHYARSLKNDFDGAYAAKSLKKEFDVAYNAHAPTKME